jgi:hypothetical protein
MSTTPSSPPAPLSTTTTTTTTPLSTTTTTTTTTTPLSTTTTINTRDVQYALMTARVMCPLASGPSSNRSERVGDDDDDTADAEENCAR